MVDADGKKSDNASSSHSIAPTKPWTDTVLELDGFIANRYALEEGYWQIGGNNVITIPIIISDRLTGRPAKVMKTVRLTGSVASYTNNGASSIAASAVTGSDIQTTTAVSTTKVIDVITDASPAGGDGSNYALDVQDFIPPDHGTATLDAGTGEITYVPDFGYSGSDEMYVFVKSGNRFKTIRVSILIGAASTGLTTPVVDTHFSAADGGDSASVDITLSEKPDTDGRRILYTQYSTDAGTTWRRLCNGFPKNIINVTTESDGTAIAAGSYNLRLRYRTDYEYGYSAASADDPVTVA